MAYDLKLASRIRAYLSRFPRLKVEEKIMFKGLTFMVNGKMCVNVSGENLMCRFDPLLTKELTQKKGYLPMIMKDKEYKGYCYVEPMGFVNENDFVYWMDLCLKFNEKAKASK
jgi:hypothetical protein